MEILTENTSVKEKPMKLAQVATPKPAETPKAPEPKTNTYMEVVQQYGNKAVDTVSNNAVDFGIGALLLVAALAFAYYRLIA